MTVTLDVCAGSARQLVARRWHCWRNRRTLITPGVNTTEADNGAAFAIDLGSISHNTNGSAVAVICVDSVAEPAYRPT